MNNKTKIKPMILDCLKGYSGKQFASDVVSGIIVAIIALPLSIALALASGVGPEEGIYTAIIAGFLISAFGGSKVQIAGPTAAFATIVAGIVAKNGLGGLAVATIIAGILLIIMGVLKLGTLIKFIPYTITTGFTAGIAVTIFIGQIKDFLGLTYAQGVKPIETMEKIEAIVKSITTINIDALIIGAISLVILIIWPKINQKIPGSLIAVIAGILIVKFTTIKPNTIGDLYIISNKLPSLSMPNVSFSTINSVWRDGLTIAVLAAIESLLSCVVADGMIGDKHRSNTELVAQGIGNIGSALFGGIPATGAIARTAANIKNGGKTPVAGMTHSIVLVLVLVVLMPYAALIPMPTIAAILFMVAYNMCQWRQFVELCKKAPKMDILVLVVTFILTVVFDLVVAIEFGMVIACVLFMKRMSDETEVKGWKYFNSDYDTQEELMDVPVGIHVYELSGPMFFGVADMIDDISYDKEITKCLILRMRGVPAVDITAMKAIRKLFEKCKKDNVILILSHVNAQPRKMMIKDGFLDEIKEKNIASCIEEAVTRGKEILTGNR